MQVRRLSRRHPRQRKPSPPIADLLVDEEDRHFLTDYPWWYLSSNGYAIANIYEDGHHRTLRLQRLILGCPDHLLVDHINGNTLDNRRANLRIATVRLNIANRHRAKRLSAAGARAVRRSRSGKWVAYIGLFHRQLYLGVYNTIEQAVAARQAAELEHFGELCPIPNVG